MTRFKTLTLAAGLLALGATTAIAAPVVGLVGDRTLVLFDTDDHAVDWTIEVGGVERLAGIDLRPIDGTLIGVTTENVIVTIDLETGAASELAAMDTPLAIGDAPVIVDFNPMADRLRYMTGTTNHRVNVDTGEVTVDGKLAFADSDMHAGEAPNIVAAAYTNSHGKPQATAMYDIDATIGGLIRQVSPNDGTLEAVGKLGIDSPGEVYAFDIQTDEAGTNTAWLVTGGALYTVDLETGAAIKTGDITGMPEAIRDIAVLPAM
jgi:hypothetical protein